MIQEAKGTQRDNWSNGGFDGQTKSSAKVATRPKMTRINKIGKRDQGNTTTIIR